MVSFPVSKQQGGHPMKATGANPEHTVKLILRSVLLLDGQPTLVCHVLALSGAVGLV